MIQHQEELRVHTRPRRLHDLTREVARAVSASGIDLGVCHLHLSHTSASLLIQENADPAVLRDLERFFARLVVDGDPLFEHDAEGPDDMPAHVRTALTGVQLAIPVRDGRMLLGTWQGIYLWEHRTHAHDRRVVVHLIGEESGV